MRPESRVRSTDLLRGRPATQLPSTPGVVPAAVAVGGRGAEAGALLALRVLRAASVSLIVIGAAVAIRSGDLDEVTLREITTVPGVLRAVFSPLAVLALGVALRVTLAPAAWLFALVVVLDGGLDVRTDPDGRWFGTRVLDRFRVATAVRSLRWSTAAKRDAATRLGWAGTALVAAEWGLRGVSGLCGVVVVLLLVLQP